MLNIQKVTTTTLPELTNLICEYQEFYKHSPDYNHNLEFLRGFLENNDGIFFIASINTQYVGYVNFYFSYSSVTARKIAILNDLYVRPQFRNQGIGRQLIDFAINYAKISGIKQIRWFTRIDNTHAQKLYAKYNTTKTDWFHYDLSLD